MPRPHKFPSALFSEPWLREEFVVKPSIPSTTLGRGMTRGFDDCALLSAYPFLHGASRLVKMVSIGSVDPPSLRLTALCYRANFSAWIKYPLDI